MDQQTEGVKFWLKVMNDLRNRGVADILIAVVDGLKGFPEAINSVFPKTMVHTCIVHLICNSLSFVSWKDRKAILPSIKVTLPPYVERPAWQELFQSIHTLERCGHMSGLLCAAHGRWPR
ncbi:hypothetical protein GWE18_40125 [Bradyrhizobium sp. CSA112]|nr:hypothetical protein [Bradyrhizobium sp. CSA112]